MLVQLADLRRGEVRFKLFCAVIGIDGRNVGAGRPLFAFQVFVEYVFDEIRRGGFSFGAGDADKIEVFPHAVVKIIEDDRHGAADIAYNYASGACGIFGFRKIAECAVRQSFG